MAFRRFKKREAVPPISSRKLSRALALVGILVLASPGLPAARAGEPRGPSDTREISEASSEELWRGVGLDLAGALGRVDPASYRQPVRPGGNPSKELRRGIDSALADWRSRRAGGPGSTHAPGLGPIPEPLIGALGRVSRELRRLEGGEAAPAGRPGPPDARLLDAIRGLVRMAEKYGRGGPPRWAVDPAITHQAAPANDACASATPIPLGSVAGSTGEATNDGSATCGLSASTPDVWYTFTATGDDDLVFDTFGSPYDTVLSLHSGCPGTTANELTCNDDSGSLQSKVSWAASNGEQVWIRVSGFNGATGAFTLSAEVASGLSGTVTETGTSSPLAGVTIDVYDETGSWRGLEFTASDGTYTVNGLPPGTYFVHARTPDFVDELWDDIVCVGFCDPTSGNPVAVAAGTVVSGIDFALDPGGSISGTVTEAGSSTPVSSGFVDVFDASGGFVSGASLAADGTYSVGGLPAGSYRVLAAASGYVDELYDDIPCPVGNCFIPSGTPVAVTDGVETSGIDFGLSVGGSISGTVTETGTSSPIPDVFVEVLDSGGAFVGFGFTAADGSYEADGLPSGSLRARTSSSAHLDEIFDDLPCSASCDVTAGTAIPVSAGAETGGIDFELSLGGSISGTITESGSSAALQDVAVFVRDSTTFEFLGAGFSGSDGGYMVGGLPPGNHIAVTFSTFYLDELYDDIACTPFCDLTTGTPISVVGGSETGGIDFELVLGGSIAGTVTESGTSAPLGGATVRVLDAFGVAFFGLTSSDGTYTVAGLPGGTYRAVAESASHAAELYDGIPCHAAVGGCAVASGTAIPVTLGNQSSGVDFSLDAFGSITGTVTEAGTGTPLSGAAVTAYGASGLPFRGTTTAGDGSYVLTEIPPGQRFVVAGPTATHAAQLFDTLPFGLWSVWGTSVDVASSMATSGVDFALWPLGACGLPGDLFLSGITIPGVAEFAACDDVTAGPAFVVGSSGDAALRAGGSVILAGGLSVLGGGGLEISSHSIFLPTTGDEVYREDFDDGFPVGWDSSNGEGDLWRLASDCWTPPSGSWVLSFDRAAPDCDYDVARTVAGWARSPVIDLSGATSASLRFQHFWETEGGGFFDQPTVEVSANGGATWTTVWTSSAATSGGWVPFELDVSGFATSQFRVRFSIDTIDSILNDFLGWAIDDVVVTAE
jgi:hypothetical protein